MIFGIGVDLVDTQRMKKVIERWGDRFLKRVFTPTEIEICSKRNHPYSAFSVRFAAKEACSKALGLGMRGGVRWRDMEVYNEATGKPGLKVHGNVGKICEENHICAIHLSLSDEEKFAIATVVLEKRDENS